MSVSIKARIFNIHGYYLEVQNDGTLTSTKKGDTSNGILEFTTTDYGKITIKGTQAGLYIYAKSDGSLGTSAKTNSNTSSLTWEEAKQKKQKYTTFRSLSAGGYLSIRKNGKTRAAKKAVSQLGRSELWAFQSV